MLRLPLFLLLLARSSTTYLTDPPSFADRLGRLYEKIEKFTVAPKLPDRLYEKIERLNSLTPARGLTDDDEELLNAIQLWGANEEQMRGYIQEIQRMKEERSERLTDGEYADPEWNDEDDSDPEGDYANDVGEEWDPIEDDIGSTSKPVLATPSAITKLNRPKVREPVESAVEALAATNERPRIFEASNAEERAALRRAAMENMGSVVRAGECLVPQARWLSVRKLAPAADTVYLPPCVKLHRCAPDSGCCNKETDVCSPVEGRYVTIPFFLNNANGNLTAVRMLFYNHTRCACVSRESLTSVRVRVKSETHVDWRPPVPTIQPVSSSPTEEPFERDEEQTEPPMMRRCTCPRLFRNRISDGVCSCICDWADAGKRRDCLSLARGREHFGLRDRVCIEHGSCALPSCEHGAYDRKAGRCPSKRSKRRLISQVIDPGDAFPRYAN